MYFVTFRLADSIPQVRLKQWLAEKETWLRTHPEPLSETQRAEFWERFPARFHQWLDLGYGSCALREQHVKEFLEGVLRHFDKVRYRLGEHVIMPNHVHTVVTPLEHHDLSAILHSWKSFSATEINKRLGQKGALWQKESFDHIVRTPAQLERINQYVRENPLPPAKAKRHPCRFRSLRIFISAVPMK